MAANKSENPFDNEEKKDEKETPETSATPEPTGEKGYVDSESGGIQNLHKILNIPMEEAGGNKNKPLDVPADPLSSGEPKSKNPFDEEGDLGLDSEDMEGLGDMFDDVEALSEFGVEILDLGMNYAAQAISGDWGQDEKYSIPESRKRKLRKPLAAVLKKRSPKVSPELALAVFVLGAYAPMLIQAYSERQKKVKVAPTKDKNGAMVVPKEDPNFDDSPDDYSDLLTQMRNESIPQPAPEPKRRPGRPKGSKDTKPRKSPAKSRVKRTTTARKTAVEVATSATNEKAS